MCESVILKCTTQYDRPVLCVSVSVWCVRVLCVRVLCVSVCLCAYGCLSVLVCVCVCEFYVCDYLCLSVRVRMCMCVLANV